MALLKVFLALAAFYITQAAIAIAQEPDIVISGSLLSQVRHAVSARNPGVLSLATPQLLIDLYACYPDVSPAEELQVLFIPRSAGPDNPVINRLYDGDKFVLELYENVDPADIAALRQWVKNRISRVVARYTSLKTVTPKDTAELLAAIDSVPAADRAAFRAFAGGVLADLGVSDPKLTPLVEESRKALTDLAVRKGRLESPLAIPSGELFSFGPRPLTERHPSSIPSNLVTDLKVGETTYRRGWVGSSMVLSKPDPKTPPPKGSPSTIDKFGLKPNVASRLKVGGELRATRLPALPTKAQ
jgi:hypothetical protein